MYSFSRTGLVYDEMMSRHYHMWNDKFTEKPERILEPYKRCQKYGLVERCQKIQVIRYICEYTIYNLHTIVQYHHHVYISGASALRTEGQEFVSWLRHCKGVKHFTSCSLTCHSALWQQK